MDDRTYRSTMENNLRLLKRVMKEMTVGTAKDEIPRVLDQYLESLIIDGKLPLLGRVEVVFNAKVGQSEREKYLKEYAEDLKTDSYYMNMEDEEFVKQLFRK
jgi:hypothetical protein